MAGIFQFDLVLLKMCQRFSQRRHVRKMEGHVIDRLRTRLTFEQRDRYIFVPDCHAVIEFELFL